MIEHLGLVLVLFSLLCTGLKSSLESEIIVNNMIRREGGERNGGGGGKGEHEA